LEYEPLVPNLFLLADYSVLIIFGVIFTTALFLRWYERKVKSAKLIFFTFLSFLIAIIALWVGYLDAFIIGYKRPIYIVSMGLGFSFSMISIHFLILFAEEIFGFDRKYTKKYLIVAIILAFLAILPNNYYGFLEEEKGIFGPSIRLYTSILLFIFALLIYTRIAISSFKIVPRVETNYARNGFRSIGISQICMILVYLFVGIDVIIFTFDKDSPGYTIFASIAWIFASIYLIFAYAGYVLPGMLRKREILLNKKKKKGNEMEIFSEEGTIEKKGHLHAKKDIPLNYYQILCPICGGEVRYNFTDTFIQKRMKIQKGIVNLLIKNCYPCGHSFIAYIDKEFQIRGTEVLDYLSQ
jgi:hypothetical protein